MTSHNEWYNKWISSHASTACIVRVTNKCDQQCMHCCYRSGPDQVGQMSVYTCRKINTWVPNGVVLNIMGGEFSVLDNYPEMLVAMVSGRPHIRLVTNGFWADHGANKFFDAMCDIKSVGCHKVDVVISEDSWHKDNRSRAVELLKEFGQTINLVKAGEVSVDDITPVGRAWDNNIAPRGNIQCSCESMSNMIITEDGMIGRCPYGYFPWKHFNETSWSEAQDYIWGWRSEKLAEGMNCHLCMETVKVNAV